MLLQTFTTAFNHLLHLSLPHWAPPSLLSRNGDEHVLYGAAKIHWNHQLPGCRAWKRDVHQHRVGGLRGQQQCARWREDAVRPWNRRRVAKPRPARVSVDWVRLGCLFLSTNREIVVQSSKRFDFLHYNKRKDIDSEGGNETFSLCTVSPNCRVTNAGFATAQRQIRTICCRLSGCQWRRAFKFCFYAQHHLFRFFAASKRW